MWADTSPLLRVSRFRLSAPNFLDSTYASLASIRLFSETSVLNAVTVRREQFSFTSSNAKERDESTIVLFLLFLLKLAVEFRPFRVKGFDLWLLLGSSSSFSRKSSVWD